MRITDTANDTLIDQYIDRVSAQAAGHCKLAYAGATPPTFGAETLRATWFAEPGCYYRRDLYVGDEIGLLILPWRTPLVAITSVVENGVTLTEGTDYELMAGGLLQRLSSDTLAPKLWSGGKIVVVYTAGWSLPASVPPEIEGPVIEQVKMAYLATEEDPRLRSETTEGVGSESRYDSGGGNIGESGLLRSLETALTPFRSWTIA
jgi:hypothetical protein